MTKSEKRQICVAGIILIALMSGIIYLIYSLPPIVRIVPVKQALENVEADRRAKALEAKALEAQPPKEAAPPSSAPTATEQKTNP
ncbi:MAG: hypothetical protein GX751_02580 [Desulfuromonadaceae bacterium]|nr:hypothetical protein [Desulfuromonadaceae bacterium]